MNKRTKDAMLKSLRKECAKLAATRDNLRDLQEELEAQLENAKEATVLLEDCIDRLSELN